MADEKLAIDGGTPVHRGPYGAGSKFGKEELKELIDVVYSGTMFRWSGTKVKQLEEDFAKLLGVKHAVASTSGTACIHVAVGMVNPNPGDEIITAPITDIGTVIPILYQTAIPIFADVDPETLNIDPADVERKITDKTKAIIVVHLSGNPADMDAIMDIAEPRGITVIEDCSQAHLSEYKGRYVGTVGHIGCFSMQQSKHMTCGDGGLTVTSNDDYALRGKLFADKGWHRDDYGPRKYTLLGLNYRMTELQGAVGCAQLRKLKSVVEARRRNGDALSALIQPAQHVRPQKLLPGCKHTYWHYELLVAPGAPFTADEFAAALRAEGVPVGAHYIGKPIFLCHEALAQKRIFGDSQFPFDHPNARKDVSYEAGMCPKCEDALERLMVIPMSEFYTEANIQDMAQAILKVDSGLGNT